MSDYQAIEKLLATTPPEQWIIEQQIILDWCDGAREGFCKLTFPDCTLYFRIIGDEPHHATEVLEQLFLVQIVEARALQPLISILGTPYSQIWKFNSDAEKELADKAVQEILLHLQPPRFIVRSENMRYILQVWRYTPNGKY